MGERRIDFGVGWCFRTVSGLLDPTMYNGPHRAEQMNSRRLA
jgi:hypothetical protein